MDTKQDICPWLKNYPPGIDWHMPIPVKPLHLLFEDTAKKYAARPYLNFLGKSYTYGEIASLVDRAAKGLQQIGAKQGTKIGLCLPNTPYYVICYFAILKIGATIVNFNPLYTVPELAHQMADSEAEIMITMDLALTLPKVMAARAMPGSPAKKIVACAMTGILPGVKSWFFRLFLRGQLAKLPADDSSVIAFDHLVDNDGKPAAVAIDAERDLAVLQYTGGTTGVPKGAMLTHKNLYANAAQCAAWFQGAEMGGERFAGVLPFFHVFAMTAVLNISTYWGAEIFLLPKFDIKSLLKTMEKARITVLAAVPGILNAINEYKDIKSYDLRALRFCISGGAPLPAAVAEKFAAVTGVAPVEGYGLSETSPVVTINPLDRALRVPNSIGLPVPQTILEIVDAEDKVTVLPPGQKGEVSARGPQVMLGYWKKPEETAKAIVNGRFLTGDIGIMDETGHFSIVDRLKDMIVVNGMKIYPREVEEVAYRHPAIAECVVAGVPDSKRGETVMAWVRLRASGMTNEAELQDYFRKNLAPYKVPRHIEIRDALPKTLIGKSDRKALVAEAEKKASRQ